jgi:Uma2 family endonuclease
MATARKVNRYPALHGVSYDVYVRLRDDRRNKGLRMTYRNGKLEYMSPEYTHESPADQLGMIVRAVAAEFDIDCKGARCTTFRRGVPGTRRGSGKEPDNSYYIQHAASIRAGKPIDLKVDPPPDLWIEVDNRGNAWGRLPVYASLGVPEVWRFRARRGDLWFGRLEDGRYVETDRSLCLPMLTRVIVLDLLQKAFHNPSETAWDKETRAWLRETLRPVYEANL